MKNLIRDLLVIFALEGVNSYLMLEQWTPTVEIVLRLLVFSSQFYVFYLVIKVIKELNPMLKEKFSKYGAMGTISLVGLLFTASFVVVNLMYLFIFVFSPHFVREVTFKNRGFYFYDSSGFLDSMMDVCTKSKYEVTRKRLITIDNDYNLSLYQKENRVILKTLTRGDIEIYDLNGSTNLYGGE